MYLIKKYFGKLNKKQLEEIGTLKSPTKPLYIIKQNVENLRRQKEELEMILPTKFEIDEEIKQKQKEIASEEETLKILQELERVNIEVKLEEEKINMNIKAKEELQKTKEEIKKELDEIKSDDKKPKKLSFLYIIPVAISIITIILFIMENLALGMIGAVLTVIIFFFIIFKNIKEINQYKNVKDEEIRAKKEVQNKLDLIENEINAKNKQIEETKELQEYKQKMKKDAIISKYPKANKFKFENFDSRSNILEEQNYINELKLSIAQKELTKKQITESLETLVEIEEKLKINEENLKELIENDEIINIAKEALVIAYNEMKESITPKFTENLSNSISTITSGKYKKVKVNEENEIILETENRKLYYS
ncbi:MAG: hypothetical protein HFJ50_02935 [Clostridia bacterium]|jgi:hypothetical protein|nr:hypothetical protein [Clostridia bacterium]